MKMKKILGLTLAFALAAAFVTGCSSEQTSQSSAASTDTEAAETASVEPTTIKIAASPTPHAEILKQAASILEGEGITLDILEVEDVITPNTGLVDGSVDANYFQHQPYLDDFNKENDTDLVSVGAVHYEPFGIYAGKCTDLSQLSDGAKIAVPNNTTNEARALLLLEQEGIIEVDDNAGIGATVNDITSNPKNVEIIEVDPGQIARSLPDVDLGIINGNFAFDAGLSANDALAVESDQGIAAQTYANIIVVRSEDAENPAILKLVEVLQSQEIQDYITNTYEGAVVPIK